MLILGSSIVASLTAAAWADDWPQFRGPNGSAVSAEKELPDRVGRRQERRLEGQGARLRLVVAHRLGRQGLRHHGRQRQAARSRRAVRAAAVGGFGPGGGCRPAAARRRRTLSTNGRSIASTPPTARCSGKQTAAEHKPTIPIQASNTYATETPVTDGERIYAYFGMTGVFCYDFDGKQLWKKDLGSYRMAMGYGTASSPALDGERLFIQCDNEEKSFLVALNKKTGEELWRMDATEKLGLEHAAGLEEQGADGDRVPGHVGACAPTTRPRARSCGSWAA